VVPVASPLEELPSVVDVDAPVVVSPVVVSPVVVSPEVGVSPVVGVVAPVVEVTHRQR